MAYHANYLLNLLLFLLLGLPVVAQTGFTVTAPLHGDDRGGLYLGGQAYLTAEAGVDDIGQGWLRLTEAVGNQYGYAVINKAFPSTLGVEMDFEFVIWGGSGADGFSIFLFDADYDPELPAGDPFHFRVGGMGGALGYAMREPDEPGLTGGYIGFGIDEWGNYTVSSEGKPGGVGVQRVAGVTDGIGVRGSEKLNYAWLGGNTNLDNSLGIDGFKLDYKPSVSQRPDPGIYYRRIFLAIEPIYENGHIVYYELSAKMQIDPDSDAILILDKLRIEEAPPDFLKVGFAAVTGGSTHIHEVRNLYVTTPGDVWVRKTVDKGEVYVSEELVYTIKMMNQFDLHAEHLVLRDVFPEHFRVDAITFRSDEKPGTRIVSGWTPGDMSLDEVFIDLAAFSEVEFEVRGVVTDVPEGNSLINTVTFDVTEQTGFTDNKEENNISTVNTSVIKPEITTEDDTFQMRIGLPLQSMNVLQNDQVDGDLVDLQSFYLKEIVPAESIDGGAVPFLDIHTGDIVLPAGVFLGEYLITYGLCELRNPNNCTESTVFVRIDPNVLSAHADDFGNLREGVSNSTPSVLVNDTWNNLSIDLQNIQLEWIDSPAEGITLHADGTVTVSALAKAARYVFHYRLCELDYPYDCSESTVSFQLKNILDAKDDFFTLVIDRGSVSTSRSVLSNDYLLDMQVSSEDLRLVPGIASHPALTMDADGVITVAKDTKVGRYTYTYTVCELIRPDNCQTATAVIDLRAKDLFAPNIITPNNDGMNDRFVVIGYENYDQIGLLVFNNWGVEVFRDADYKNDWKADGLGQGVYYYVLYFHRDGYTMHKRGYVIVKRE